MNILRGIQQVSRYSAAEKSFSSSSSSSKIRKPSITLFQYTICPFCNINKALLSYTDTPFSTIEVNPLTKAEIKFSKDYKKVPIALIDDEQINGSRNINMAILRKASVIDSLEQKWLDTQSMRMETFSSPNANKWVDFANDELAPILYPNICNTLGASWKAFDYVKKVPEFSFMQKMMIQGMGSVAMYLAASKIKNKRSITDEREALSEVLSRWENEGLDDGHKIFGSGTNVPDLGDIALYGVLNSVKGLKAHDEAVLMRGGTVTEWFKRMEDEVQGQKIYV